MIAPHTIWRRRTLFGAVFTALFALAACSPTSPTPADEPAAPADGASGDEAQAEQTEPAEEEAAAADGAVRIVTLSGGVSETVAALGFGDQIVATDVSSVYPESLTELPQVGYHRMFSAEGVIATNPTHVFGSELDGPESSVNTLDGLEAPYLRVPEVKTVEDAYARTRTLAEALDVAERGEELVATIQAKLDEVAASLPPVEERPKVLLVYARGHGTVLATGTNSAGDTIINLAGGVNAVTGYEGFRPLTPESLVAAQPDVIVVPARGLESLGGEEGVLSLPGMAQTPAGQNRAFITMDDALLLSFGPRLGEAVETLAGQLSAPTL